MAKAYTEKLTILYEKQCLILAKQKKVEIEKLYKTAHVDQYKFVSSFETDTDEEAEQFEEINRKVRNNVIKLMGGTKQVDENVHMRHLGEKYFDKMEFL